MSVRLYRDKSKKSVFCSGFLGKMKIKKGKMILEDIKPNDTFTHIITAAYCVY